MRTSRWQFPPSLKWYDLPLPRYSVIAADTLRDLDLLTLVSGHTWRVTWSTPPPSLKILCLTVLELWVLTSPIGYHWQDRAGHLQARFQGEGVVPLPIYWYHSKGDWMLYNVAADSFYIMKLCNFDPPISRLFVLDCRSRPKYDTSLHFDPPFWGTWGRRRTLVDGSLESPCRVLVKHNWTSFSISYGWGATRQNVSKLAAFSSG